MISKKNIQEITDTCRIEDVVGDYVNLKRRGSNMIGLCPFHNEKTPSFNVSPSRNIFKCFGCGKGGDSVHFIMEHEHFSYPEALRFLAGKYNIKLEEREETNEEKLHALEEESLYIVNQFAQEYFSKNLTETEEGKTIGLTYFNERGFRDEQLQKFHLGYSMKQTDAFLQEAKSKGHNVSLLKKAGLISERENGSFDFFRHRVIFPIHNLSGKTVAFAGRILIKDDKQPKYINSPETEIYSKSKLLYGIFQAKNEIRKKNEVFLTEGYTDVISMHMAGIENVVASSGTSLTIDQIKLIKRFTQNITILYDGDAAGIKAALRGLEMVIEEDMNVRMVLLPDGEDPDSFVQKNGADNFNKFVKKNAKNFVLFKTDVVLKDSEGDPLKKAQVIREIVETIAHIPDPIKRSLFVKECSRLLDIQENLLITEVNKSRRKIVGEKLNESPRRGADELPAVTDFTSPVQGLKSSGIEPQERDIIRLLLEYGELMMDDENSVGDLIVEEFKEIEMKTSVYNLILEEFKKQFAEGNKIDFKYFNTHTNEKVKDAVLDVIGTSYQLSTNWNEKFGVLVKEKSQNFLADVQSSLQYYKMNTLREMKADVLKKIKTAENETEITNHQKRLMLIQEEIKKIGEEKGTSFLGKWEA